MVYRAHFRSFLSYINIHSVLDGDNIRGVLKLLGASVRMIGENRAEGGNSSTSYVFELYNLVVTNSSSLLNKQNALRLRASSEKEMNEWIEGYHSKSIIVYIYTLSSLNHIC
jgi:hypothetical protein